MRIKDKPPTFDWLASTLIESFDQIPIFVSSTMNIPVIERLTTILLCIVKINIDYHINHYTLSEIHYTFIIKKTEFEKGK